MLLKNEWYYVIDKNHNIKFIGKYKGSDIVEYIPFGVRDRTYQTQITKDKSLTIVGLPYISMKI